MPTTFNIDNLHSTLSFIRERERERETLRCVTNVLRTRNLRIKKQTANTPGQQFIYLYNTIKPKTAGCRQAARRLAVSFIYILTSKTINYEM